MKILFIRSLQVELINSLTEKIKKKELTIDVLDNRKQNKKLSNLFRKIYLTKKIGDYGIMNLKIENIFQIRNEHYDEIYIFHKQIGIYGLQNIIFLSFFLNSKKIYHIKYDQNISSLKDKKIIKKNILFKFFIEHFFTVLIMPIVLILAIIMMLFSIFKK